MAEVSRTGGVSAEEIAQFISIAELPPEADASLDSRFCMDIARLVAARAASAESGAFSVFLRSEAIKDDAEKSVCVNVPFLSNGNDPISDSAWLATVGLRSSYRLALDVSKDAKLIEAVIEAGLGDLPAVIVDWRGNTPVGRLYREGLVKQEIFYQVSFSELPISEKELKDSLDSFYEKVLRTPSVITQGHGNRIWGEKPGSAGKGIPSHRPEERIQGRLLDALKGSYPTHTWRAEPVTEDGRADVVAIRKVTVESRPATITEWVLELKALADMTSTGKPVSKSVVLEAVISALEQVLAYKANHNAERAAVCYFDMRVDDIGDDDCFIDIIDEAQDQSIPLWRWYLYRSTAASRKARKYINSSAG